MNTAIDPEERADFVYDTTLYTRASDNAQVYRRTWILGDLPPDFAEFVTVVVMNFKDGLGNVIQDTGVAGIPATSIREAFEKVNEARAAAKKALIQRRVSPGIVTATEEDLAKMPKVPFKM